MRPLRRSLEAIDAVILVELDMRGIEGCLVVSGTPAVSTRLYSVTHDCNCSKHCKLKRGATPSIDALSERYRIGFLG